MDDPKTPYQKGYKAGREGNERDSDVYDSLADKASYFLGYGYGAMDREAEVA